MGFWDDVRSTVSSIAPTLGAALGGPLGGLAGQAIASVLGVDPTDDAAVKSAIKGMTGEQALELKKAEAAFQQRMKELEVDVLRLNVDDRNSARQREIAVKDHMPMILGILVTLGFFGVLGYILVYGVPEKGGEALFIMLGTLGGAWGGVMAYYFGSSMGSRVKDLMALHQSKRGK